MMFLDVMNFSGIGEIALPVIIIVAVIAVISVAVIFAVDITNRQKTKKLIQDTEKSKKEVTKDDVT